MTSTLEVTELVKSFGSHLVLDGVGLELRGGEIHALLGGNGSGKSTLVKILAGVHQADAGTLRRGERTLHLAHSSPAGARELGLRFVHQDLGLVEEMTIAENLALSRGYPRTVVGGINWGKVNREAARLLEPIGLGWLGPATRVHDLNPPQRSLVAVVRALADAAPGTTLLLDEPTATMPPAASAQLLETVRSILSGDVAVMLVTHRIGEVLRYCDRLSCLRDGRAIVAGEPTSAYTPDDVVGLISPDAKRTAVRRATTAGRIGAEVVARVTVPAAGGGEVEIAVRAGEILGIAGLVGSGRTRTLGRFFGLGRKPHADAPRDPFRAVRHGVGYVPEHRATHGAFGDLSIAANVVAPVEGRYWRGWMSKRRQRRDAEATCAQCFVEMQRVDDPITVLSGGNQQKVMMARWMLARSHLLLLDEPTQGVDVGGRAQLHRLIQQRASGGVAVIVSSSDLEEITTLCDRVVVLTHGLVAGELSGGDIDPATIEGIAQNTRDGLGAATS